MNYGTLFNPTQVVKNANYVGNYNDNYDRYVGYRDQGSDCLKNLFSPQTIQYLSAEITLLLEGVEPCGKKIVVTDDVIGNVLSDVYNAYTPEIGDIFTRYNIVRDKRSDFREILNRVLQIIVGNTKTEYEMKKCNDKLSIWNTVLGDFNENGLRSHPPIKLRNKRPQSMMFNMNY